MKKYLFLFIHVFCLCLKVEAGIFEAVYYQEDTRRLINAYPAQLEKRKNRKALKKYIQKRCEQLETMKRFIPAYASILADTYNYNISLSKYPIVQSYRESIKMRVDHSFITYLNKKKNIPLNTLNEVDDLDEYLPRQFNDMTELRIKQCNEELEYHYAFLARLNEEYPRTCVLI